MMIRLVSSIFNFFSSDGQTNFVDSTDRDVLHSDLEGLETDPHRLKDGSNSSKLRKVMYGTVTTFYDGHGLIDDYVYFTVDNVVGGAVPLVGCYAEVEATRVHQHAGWIAERVDIVSLWDSESDNEERTEIVIGKITHVKGNEVVVNDTLYTTKSTCKVGYSPFRGDFVQVELSSSEDENCKMVQSISPVREKTCTGVVTEILKSYGFVNDDIYFPFSACVKGYYAKEGDHVKVFAVESKQVRGEWRASSIMPFSTDREKAINKSYHGVQSEKLKVLMQDKNGIAITDDLNFGNMSIGSTNSLTCVISNDGSESQFFNGVKLSILDDQFSFAIPSRYENKSKDLLQYISVQHDNDGTDSHLFARREVKPKEMKFLTMKFSARSLGKVEQLITFAFEGFEIGRCLSATVSDPLQNAIKENREYSGHGRKKSGQIYQYGSSSMIAGEKPLRRKKNFIPNRLKQYQVPGDIRNCLLEEEDIELLVPSIAMPLTWKIHRTKFTALLYMEEVQAEEEMKSFDLHKITLRPFNEFLLIEVPGLAEGRPSLLLGDRLALKFSGDDFPTEYEGFIHEVRAEDVLVKFNVAFHQQYRNEDCDIHFFGNRTTTRRCHQALEIALNVGQQALDFFNKKLNERQQAAVQRIVAGQGRPFPYLLFGPPGTGKTMTTVEAILQVFTHVKGSRILAAAPSNSAADLIVLRLHESGLIRKKDMVRLNAFQRSADMQEEIECYSVKETDDLGFASRHRIIVSTCSTSAQLCSLKLQVGHFTHIFCDEAGQATEPECLIPIGLIAENPDSQVVLAGDPRQLGPVLRSSLASVYGLSTSLLERLMDREPYRRNMKIYGHYGGYNPLIITKLIYNYRSHPSLLELSSNIFYDAEMIPAASKSATNIFIDSDLLVAKTCPFIFHGIRGEDIREGDSPSWFNSVEAVQVLHYVQKIVGKFSRIQPSDIGIITPYRKQVEKIRLLLSRFELNDIKVGSVEEFQGQERPVIIISTVRSNETIVGFDVFHNIGFLSNPKRFNVAITRAEALLVVIGNPYVLCRDPYWCSLIQYAIMKETYVGCSLPTLDDPHIEECFKESLRLLGLEGDENELNEDLNTEVSSKTEKKHDELQHSLSRINDNRCANMKLKCENAHDDAEQSAELRISEQANHTPPDQPHSKEQTNSLQSFNCDVSGKTSIGNTSKPNYEKLDIGAKIRDKKPAQPGLGRGRSKVKSKAYNKFLSSFSNSSSGGTTTDTGEQSNLRSMNATADLNTEGSSRAFSIKNNSFIKSIPKNENNVSDEASFNDKNLRNGERATLGKAGDFFKDSDSHENTSR